MSLRIDTTEWISGSLIIGETGLGTLGSSIPPSGDNGPGYTYNDLSLPADSGKEICGRITTWPSSGTLFAYEDTSFIFTAPDGTYSFQYQLYVDGVATGSPVTVGLQVGPLAHAVAGNLTSGGAVVSGSAARSVTFVTHSSSGGLVSGVATLSGVISRTNGVITHAASGSLVAQAAAISGYDTVPAMTLSQADVSAIVNAVLAALNATAIPVDVHKVLGTPVAGEWPAANDIIDGVWNKTLP